MVAQSASMGSYYLPKAGQEAAGRNALCTSKPRQPFHIPKGVALPAVGKEEREEEVSGEESEGSDAGQDAADQSSSKPLCQNIKVEDPPEIVTEEEEDDRLVMADTGEDDGEDEQDDLSLSTDGDDSQDGKTDRNPGWRKKSQQKMNYGKKWITRNLVFEKDGCYLVPLSVISGRYLDDCQREGQEPLKLSVLARLLHQQFPKAGKCRLGSRKNQKIHYSKLRWQTDSISQQCNSATTPLTPPADERAEKTPFEGSLSPQMHGDIRGPQPIMSGSRGMEKRQHLTTEVQSASPNQPPPNEEDEGEKECLEAATRLQQVVKKVSSQGKRGLLLKSFAHSASCRTTPCTSLCLMFRRVRRHVVMARHPCQVMRIYSVLLKLHVASCVINDCGLTACPVLRASRNIKRGLDEVQEEGQQQPEAKKSCTQDNGFASESVEQPTPPSPPDSPHISMMSIASPAPNTESIMCVVPVLHQGVCSTTQGITA